MNLNEKPLYALRDLGIRLGVPSATKYTKDVLIEKIYKRKREIENGMPAPPKSVHGRPKLKSCFIGIEKGENGKIVFFDADVPEPKKEISDDKSKETVAKNKKEIENEIKRLEESKKVFISLIDAIDCRIETLRVLL